MRSRSGLRRGYAPSTRPRPPAPWPLNPEPLPPRPRLLFPGLLPAPARQEPVFAVNAASPAVNLLVEHRLRLPQLGLAGVDQQVAPRIQCDPIGAAERQADSGGVRAGSHDEVILQAPAGLRSRPGRSRGTPLAPDAPVGRDAGPPPGGVVPEEVVDLPRQLLHSRSLTRASPPSNRMRTARAGVGGWRSGVGGSWLSSAPYGQALCLLPIAFCPLPSAPPQARIASVGPRPRV